MVISDVNGMASRALKWVKRTTQRLLSASTLSTTPGFHKPSLPCWQITVWPAARALNEHKQFNDCKLSMILLVIRLDVWQEIIGRHHETMRISKWQMRTGWRMKTLLTCNYHQNDRYRWGNARKVWNPHGWVDRREHEPKSTREFKEPSTVRTRTVLSVIDSIPSTTALCRGIPLMGQLIFTLQLVPRENYERRTQWRIELTGDFLDGRIFFVATFWIGRDGQAFGRYSCRGRVEKSQSFAQVGTQLSQFSTRHARLLFLPKDGTFHEFQLERIELFQRFPRCSSLAHLSLIGENQLRIPARFAHSPVWNENQRRDETSESFFVDYKIPTRGNSDSTLRRLDEMCSNGDRCRCLSPAERQWNSHTTANFEWMESR